MPRPNTSEIDQEKKQPMKAKLVAYSYLCINRSGSTRTDSVQVFQKQLLQDKHKRIPKDHNTLIVKLKQLCKSQPDQPMK